MSNTIALYQSELRRKITDGTCSGGFCSLSGPRDEVDRFHYPKFHISCPIVFRLVLLLRAPSNPTKALPIHFLFCYANSSSGSTGRARQFRHRLLMTARPLVDSRVQALNPSSGLCALQLHLPVYDNSLLVRVEVLRITPVLGVQLRGSRQIVNASIPQKEDLPLICLRHVLRRDGNLDNLQFAYSKIF
jgi:hypothetical protein